MQAPDDKLAYALECLLWSIEDKDFSVDGWTYFRVKRESENALDVVGLMTLLPSGSVPIAINVQGQDKGFVWSAQIACVDADWLALSHSRQWKDVYLYATGERQTPGWRWERQYHGSAQDTDA